MVSLSLLRNRGPIVSFNFRLGFSSLEESLASVPTIRLFTKHEIFIGISLGTRSTHVRIISFSKFIFS